MKQGAMSIYQERMFTVMKDCTALILAAGKGTRMKSGKAKVLHEVNGRPMLAFAIAAAAAAGCTRTMVVVGYAKQSVTETFGQAGVEFITQDRQMGSGHAVLCAKSALNACSGDVLILAGDVPLIKGETLRSLIDRHRAENAVVTVLTADFPDPSGYGRIVRDPDGRLEKIVEHADATEQQKTIREINTGIYCCDAAFLFDAIEKVGNNNRQGEYYLPDIVSVAVSESKKALAVNTPDTVSVKGVNDRTDLAEAEKTMRLRVMENLMLNGVTLIDPDATYIEGTVKIGPDTVIYPHAAIRGNTVIGTGTVIDMNAVIEDCTIGNNVHIKPCCVMLQTTVLDHAQVGPFAHLRPETTLEEEARVGNFVEVKKSVIGKGSKVNHLTYIGDATIGSKANIGAGTITCNYDGVHKHRTVIEDGAFIGSNASLVAPVRIGKKALIGAGSTITQDVPQEALALGRAKQATYNDFRNWKITKK